MDLGLQNKVIMVAASSKGLGFGIAKALAADGAILSLASRSSDNLERAQESLTSFTDTPIMTCTMDAKSAKEIESWTQQTLEKFGRIDGLVVNAGGPPSGQFDDFDDEAWQQAFDLTLMSAVRMIRSVLPTMKSQKSGSILSITSSSVKEPISNLLLSNVMRSGVTSLVKSLSKELAPKGIRVNNLIPGRIDTERVQTLDEIAASSKGCSVEHQRHLMEATIPMGRYGHPDEFGKMGAFLLSGASGYITGSTIVVDGGSMSTVW